MTLPLSLSNIIGGGHTCKFVYILVRVFRRIQKMLGTEIHLCFHPRKYEFEIRTLKTNIVQSYINIKVAWAILADLLRFTCMFFTYTSKEQHHEGLLETKLSPDIWKDLQQIMLRSRHEQQP